MSAVSNTPVAGRSIGSLIGSIAGLVFIVANAGQLGQPTALVVRAVGVVAFLVVLWLAVLRRSARASASGRPERRAMRVYWTCVLAEVIAIPVGVQVVSRGFGRADLGAVWVVFVVGVHFLPFASAFRAPLFRWLGRTMIVLAVLGGGVAVLADAAAAPWTAVLAGVVLLGFSLGGRPHVPSGTVLASRGETAAQA